MNNYDLQKFIERVKSYTNCISTIQELLNKIDSINTIYFNNKSEGCIGILDSKDETSLVFYPLISSIEDKLVDMKEEYLRGLVDFIKETIVETEKN